VLGELLAFSTELETHRRRQLGQRLWSFFDVEQILPNFRQAFQAIQSSDWEGAGHEALGRLIRAASTFTDEIVGDVYKEKDDFFLRARITEALEYGNWATEDDVKTVHEWAEATAKILDRRLLAEADTAFGEFRQAILAAHKTLPDPGYAVSLAGQPQR
jgi:hypothetical protein